MIPKSEEKFTDGRVTLNITLQGFITGHKIKPITLNISKIVEIDPKNRDKTHALWRLHTTMDMMIDELRETQKKLKEKLEMCFND